MFQSMTNPDKKFGSIYVQRRYDAEKTKDKEQIFCIRHGQTAMDDLHRSDGWLDLPLNDEGRKSVVLTLADYLKKIPITTIYSSPLRRTEETADIIKSGLPSNPEIEIASSLKTWNLGSMAGDPKKPNKKVVVDLIAHPTKSAPDGESYEDFTNRFDKWLEIVQNRSKKYGPFLAVLSGSNCRRISEIVFGDRKDLDIDESGLFVLRPKGDKWTAEVIHGHRDEKDMEDNPEAS